MISFSADKERFLESNRNSEFFCLQQLFTLWLSMLFLIGPNEVFIVVAAQSEVILIPGLSFVGSCWRSYPKTGLLLQRSVKFRVFSV